MSLFTVMLVVIGAVCVIDLAVVGGLWMVTRPRSRRLASSRADARLVRVIPARGSRAAHRA